jgi:hypothetical protein
VRGSGTGPTRLRTRDELQLRVVPERSPPEPGQPEHVVHGIGFGSGMRGEEGMEYDGRCRVEMGIEYCELRRTKLLGIV